MRYTAPIDVVWVEPVSWVWPLNHGAFLAMPVNDQEMKNRDVSLLLRIAKKDRDAFAEFYDRSSTLLFSIASRILGDAIEAEDVLQETFLQIWEKAGSFDPMIGEPISWAVSMTRNRAIDRIRASKRRYELFKAAGEDYSATVRPVETANETINGKEQAAVIYSAVTSLPSEQRRAIELAFFSGLTQHEISSELKEPLGTIKARIRRGLLKLRGQLEGIL